MKYMSCIPFSSSANQNGRKHGGGMVSASENWMPGFVRAVIDSGEINPVIIANHHEELWEFLRTHSKAGLSFREKDALARIQLAISKLRFEQRMAAEKEARCKLLTNPDCYQKKDKRLTDFLLDIAASTSPLLLADRNQVDQSLELALETQDAELSAAALRAFINYVCRTDLNPVREIVQKVCARPACRISDAEIFALAEETARQPLIGQALLETILREHGGRLNAGQRGGLMKAHARLVCDRLKPDVELNGRKYAVFLKSRSPKRFVLVDENGQVHERSAQEAQQGTLWNSITELMLEVTNTGTTDEWLARTFGRRLRPAALLQEDRKILNAR